MWPITLCCTIQCTVHARVGCSKKQRNCSKKVTYGRIHRDTMHMKAIHGRGYHRRPCSWCFVNLWRNHDDSEVEMIKRTGVMGSCDPESLRRCLRQTRFLTHSSPAEKLISQTEATFTLHFFCFLSYAASLLVSFKNLCPPLWNTSWLQLRSQKVTWTAFNFHGWYLRNLILDPYVFDWGGICCYSRIKVWWWWWLRLSLLIPLPVFYGQRQCERWS